MRNMKPLTKIFNTLAVLITVGMVMTSCGSDKGGSGDDGKKESGIKKIEVDPMQNKGIGPITSISLEGSVNQEMVDAGAAVFEAKCTPCHKPTEKFIGPAPQGILERRSPEWVMNMILNPEEMVQKDDIAKKLLMEFNGSPMANQNLTEEEARSVLEYFRTL